MARRWGRAAAFACVALLPLMVAAWAQRAQVGWLRPPGISAALATGRLVGSAALILAAAVLTGTGLAHAALGRRLGSDWPVRLPALCLPWLAGPPVILFVMSQFQPAYTFRYIVFCAPAAALLIGTGLAAAGRVVTACGLALLMLLALPAQLGERGPAGHADNIRSLDQIVARYQQPGDAVLYPQGAGTRAFAAAYPFGLARLRDVMLGESAARSDTIAGTDAPPRVVRGQAGRGPPGMGHREQRAGARPARPAAGPAVPAGPRLARQRFLAGPVRVPGVTAAGDDSASRACSRSLTSSGV